MRADQYEYLLLYIASLFCACILPNNKSSSYEIKIINNRVSDPLNYTKIFICVYVLYIF